MASPPPNTQRDWALFLDIDGTLLDFAPTPDDVVVPPDLPPLLGTLCERMGGALALVSGRSLVVMDKLFAPVKLPASGQHGAELRLGSEETATGFHPALPAIAVALTNFAAAHPGVLIENKGHSIALHYRLAPAVADQAWALVETLTANAADELTVLPAQLAIDIKPRGRTKGTAVAWFMERAPFKGRVPVFAGDDTTDEDGFAAVNERGGVSIRVGAERATAAKFCIASPLALREWLAGLPRYYA